MWLVGQEAASVGQQKKTSAMFLHAQEDASHQIFVFYLTDVIYQSAYSELISRLADGRHRASNHYLNIAVGGCLAGVVDSSQANCVLESYSPLRCHSCECVYQLM